MYITLKLFNHIIYITNNTNANFIDFVNKQIFKHRKKTNFMKFY